MGLICQIFWYYSEVFKLISWYSFESRERCFLFEFRLKNMLDKVSILVYEAQYSLYSTLNFCSYCWHCSEEPQWHRQIILKAVVEWVSSEAVLTFLMSSPVSALQLYHIFQDLSSVSTPSHNIVLLVLYSVFHKFIFKHIGHQMFLFNEIWIPHLN